MKNLPPSDAEIEYARALIADNFIYSAHKVFTHLYTYWIIGFFSRSTDLRQKRNYRIKGMINVLL